MLVSTTPPAFVCGDVVHGSSLRVDEVVEALTQATCTDAHHEETDELRCVVDDHRTILPLRG